MSQMPLLYDEKRDVFEGVWSKYRFFVPQNRRPKSGGCQSLTYSQLIMNAQTPETSSSRPDRSPNKGGRPKKPLSERRDHVVKVGFDRLNYAKLKQLQQREGKSLSELVYEFAVNGYIKEALPQEVVRDIRALAGMANNLNQLAHETHLMGYIDVHQQNKELAQRIDRLLQVLAKEM